LGKEQHDTIELVLYIVLRHKSEQNLHGTLPKAFQIDVLWLYAFGKIY